MFFKLMCAGILSLLFFSTSASAQSTQKALDQAWLEYRYQEYERAQNWFERVLESDAEQVFKHQAKLGTALVKQFDERNPDLVAAIEIYEELLADDLSAELETKLFAESMLAEALFASGDTASADRIWKRIIEQNPDQFLAQDALLARSYAFNPGYDSPETAEAAAYVEEMVTSFPAASKDNPDLASQIYLFLSTYYWEQDDYEKSFTYLLKVAETTTRQVPSYTSRATTLFRIAMIASDMFNDSTTAGQYFRQMVMETPNDSRAYYAMLRAIEYGTLSQADKRRLRLLGFGDSIDEAMEQQGEVPVP